MITVSHSWSTSLLTHLPLSIAINLSHCCCHHCSCTYNPPQWPASTTTTSVSSHNLPWMPNGKMCGCKFAASCTYSDVNNHQLVLRGPGPLKIPGPSQHTFPAITKCCSKCASTCAMSMRLHQCKGNSKIPKFRVCNSCDILWFLRLCVIIHLKSCTESQHLLITQYVSLLSTLTMSFPFLFLCLATAILFHLHLISHIISNTSIFHILPLIFLLWSTAGCYALCSLCSPPSLGSP